jgi:tellurite methyltransferase
MGFGEKDNFRWYFCSMDDAERWNRRYKTERRYSFEYPRKLLTDRADLLPSHGLTLDIAMGLGGNAGFLLEHGLSVVGVDISYVAVRRVKSEYPAILAIVADLNHFYIPENTFCVITNFFYLQRNLWASMINGLVADGVLFVECLLERMLSIHPEINPEFLLKPGELKQAFDASCYDGKIKILQYHEGWQEDNTSHPRATASMILQRIG